MRGEITVGCVEPSNNPLTSSRPSPHAFYLKMTTSVDNGSLNLYEFSAFFTHFIFIFSRPLNFFLFSVRWGVTIKNNPLFFSFCFLSPFHPSLPPRGTNSSFPSLPFSLPLLLHTYISITMETLLPRSRITERSGTSSRRAATGSASTRGVLRDVSVNTQASQDNRKRKATAQGAKVFFFSFFYFFFFFFFFFLFFFAVITCYFS